MTIGKTWTPMLGWVAAIGAALGFALAAPSESSLLGKLPPLTGKRLHDQAPVALPQALTSDRTVAVVVFKKSQQDEAQRWIDGLGLHNDPSISWVRLPVLRSDGDETVRRTKEEQLLARYPGAEERARMVAVFTDDKEALSRAAGLATTEHASVLVVDRQGNVLAKAQGPYDPDKAQALRQTLVAHNNL